MDDNKLIQYVVFKIGKEMYAMNIQYTERIVSNEKIRPIPNTRKEIKGIVNIQEEIVPVLDLRVKFDLQSEKIEETPFIIVSRVNDDVVGLVVDEVIEVLPIKNDNNLGNVNPNLVGKASTYIQGIHRKEIKENENAKEKEKNFELIVILDATKLLESDELDFSIKPSDETSV